MVGLTLEQLEAFTDNADLFELAEHYAESASLGLALRRPMPGRTAACMNCRLRGHRRLLDAFGRNRRLPGKQVTSRPTLV